MFFLFFSPQNLAQLNLVFEKKSTPPPRNRKKTLWRREQKRARESESAHIKNINKPFSLVCVCAEREESEKQLLKKDALRCDFFSVSFSTVVNTNSYSSSSCSAASVGVFLRLPRRKQPKSGAYAPNCYSSTPPSQRVRCKCN